MRNTLRPLRSRNLYQLVSEQCHGSRKLPFKLLIGIFIGNLLGDLRDPNCPSKVTWKVYHSHPSVHSFVTPSGFVAFREFAIYGLIACVSSRGTNATGRNRPLRWLPSMKTRSSLSQSTTTRHMAWSQIPKLMKFAQLLKTELLFTWEISRRLSSSIHPGY